MNRSLLKFFLACNIDQVACKSSAEEFSTATERGSVAANASVNAAVFLTPSSIRILDDWCRCRCYLELLRGHRQGDDGRNGVLNRSKVEFAMVFSMIRAAAKDPQPWVFVVDHVLAKIRAALPAEQRQESAVGDILSELTQFAHGSVIKAYLTHCKKGRGRAHEIAVSTIWIIRPIQLLTSRSVNGIQCFTSTTRNVEGETATTSSPIQTRSTMWSSELQCLPTLALVSPLTKTAMFQRPLTQRLVKVCGGVVGVRELVSDNLTSSHPSLYNVVCNLQFAVSVPPTRRQGAILICLAGLLKSYCRSCPTTSCSSTTRPVRPATAIRRCCLILAY